MPKKWEEFELKLDGMAGGGQAIGTMSGGRKCFVWGGLPGETVRVKLTKKKSTWCEAVVVEVLESSHERIEPVDADSYLSTSPWQIMNFAAEQKYKSQLIHDAFHLHHVDLGEDVKVFSDGVEFGYRNKVEFSWYSEMAKSSEEEAVTGDLSPSAERHGLASATRKEYSDSEDLAISLRDTLDLAFFRRGSKGKITVGGTSLARPEINKLATQIRDLLRTKPVSARNLKTLLIRCNQNGNCVWQLYLKDKMPEIISADEAAQLSAQGGEVIYSDPRSPASRITERLASFGDIVLSDKILSIPFSYATEGFFQINIPVYEQALKDMQEWVEPLTNKFTEQSTQAREMAEASESTSSLEGFAFPAKRGQERQLDQLAAERPERMDGDFGRRETVDVLDLYSGVGSIGLTIGGPGTTLVEINEHAVREMRRNISELGLDATAVLAASENALEHIHQDQIVIVDPPRAGLHTDVVDKLLEVVPPRIIYLSCNPVTQARDVSLLLEKYQIRHTRGYNFFPRTPHIENLVIFDKI